MKKLWLALFLGAVLALAFGPSLLRREPPFDEELSIVSPHWQGIRVEFERAFSEHYFNTTGRRVRVVWLDFGSTGDIKNLILERVAQTKKRGETGIGIDLLFGGGADILPTLAASNAFERVPLPPELKKEIPPSVGGQILRDEKNPYHATCLSSFGFVFNTKVIDKAKLPTPETWEDLGRPEFQGWIACGDPSLSGSLHAAFEIVLQSQGWEKGYATLGRMMSNTRAFSEGGPSVPRDVSLGQSAAGPCIDFYATAPLRRQGATHLKLVVPKGAAVASPDGIAMLRGAPNKKAATAFVLFTLSEAGQKLWYQARGTPGGPVDYDLERLPIMPAMYESGVETHTVLNPFKAVDFTLDGKKSGGRWAILNHLMRAAWMDAHEEFFDARKAIIDAGRDVDLGAELCKPFVGEKELSELAAKKMSADDINALRNRWTAMAREHYDKCRRDARAITKVP